MWLKMEKVLHNATLIIYICGLKTKIKYNCVIDSIQEKTLTKQVFNGR